MTDPHDRTDVPPPETPEQLAREVREQNPDPTTRREAFELGLMEEDESEAGADLHVVDRDE